MPPNRRRTEITAPPDRWRRLGKLLEDRRKELGYTYRYRSSGPSFERDSNVNRRMLADFEKAAKDRINRFMPGSLHIIARGYRVTEESVRAVLRGEADELVPTPASPPFDDPVREAADRPFFDEINERRVKLALEGISSPTGAQMFGESTDDAQAWDGIGTRLDAGARMWFIADLRRLDAERVPNSGTGTDGA
jgi:hypothetical protein